jgi:hypothetical protein
MQGSPVSQSRGCGVQDLHSLDGRQRRQPCKLTALLVRRARRLAQGPWGLWEGQPLSRVIWAADSRQDARSHGRGSGSARLASMLNSCHCSGIPLS